MKQPETVKKKSEFPSFRLGLLQGKEQELAQHLHQELSEAWSNQHFGIMGAFMCSKNEKMMYRVGQGMHNSW